MVLQSQHGKVPTIAAAKDDTIRRFKHRGEHSESCVRELPGTELSLSPLNRKVSGTGERGSVSPVKPAQVTSSRRSISGPSALPFAGRVPPPSINGVCPVSARIARARWRAGWSRRNRRQHFDIWSAGSGRRSRHRRPAIIRADVSVGACCSGAGRSRALWPT